jgi:hypothetical protein
MRQPLPNGTRFEVSTVGNHKYTAILPTPNGTRRVHFGNRKYEHFQDSVPASLGGQKWSFKNHGDFKRRKSYRTRAANQKCKTGEKCVNRPYSAAWFSYHFLW